MGNLLVMINGLSDSLLFMYDYNDSSSKQMSSKPNYTNSVFGFNNTFMTSPFGLSYLAPFNLYSDSYFFNQDLYFFNMLMANQMPLTMQKQFFTTTYNTNTNLAELKDVYSPNVANRLANIACENARKTDTVGWCAKGTNDALQLAGLAKGETRVSAAYQEADILAKHPNFKEVTISKDELKSLPAGCVVVWDRNRDKSRPDSRPADTYGHIMVTLGNGKEASDHVDNILMLNTSFRVFVPIERSKGTK